MLGGMTNDCRDAGLISAFIRCHPLLPLDGEDAAWPGANRVHHGETVYVDLTHSPAVLWRNMRENHRSQIRRLIRSGFRIAFDEWQYNQAFNELYAETMNRRGADPFYLFPAEYFRELRAALNDRLHLCCVLSPEGSVAAAGLFTEVDGIVEYHLGCSSSEHLPKAPSKLMFHGALKWAAERGNRLFHLGGGTGCAADSLFAFKAGFSPLRASFDTYRVVLDPEKYNRLVNMADTMQARTAGSNFFPGYRCGLASSTRSRCEPAAALRAV
jgi:lipid II:glycine glycyltransferase (peptidoglycan interpeptide bridge formation enzyme)